MTIKKNDTPMKSCALVQHLAKKKKKVENQWSKTRSNAHLTAPQDTQI